MSVGQVCQQMRNIDSVTHKRSKGGQRTGMSADRARKFRAFLKAWLHKFYLDGPDLLVKGPGLVERNAYWVRNKRSNSRPLTPSVARELLVRLATAAVRGPKGGPIADVSRSESRTFLRELKEWFDYLGTGAAPLTNPVAREIWQVLRLAVSSILGDYVPHRRLQEASNEAYRRILKALSLNQHRLQHYVSQKSAVDVAEYERRLNRYYAPIRRLLPAFPYLHLPIDS